MPNTQAGVINLIETTEIRDVRLVTIDANVDNIPAQLNVQFNVGQIQVAQSDEEIHVSFEHSADFADGDNKPCASISLRHIARFSFEDTLNLDTLDRNTVGAWAFGNVYFMIYPYVRQALQDTCLRLGLPAVVLGYLTRGNLAPQNVSLIISTTTLAQEIPADDPLPLETTVPTN